MPLIDLEPEGLLEIVLTILDFSMLANGGCLGDHQV